MISQHVVVLAVVVECGVLAFAFLLLFLHGATARVRRRLLARRVADWRAQLIRTVNDDEEGAGVPRDVPRLPLREHLEILCALRPSIAGAGRPVSAAAQTLRGAGPDSLLRILEHPAQRLDRLGAPQGAQQSSGSGA